MIVYDLRYQDCGSDVEGLALASELGETPRYLHLRASGQAMVEAELNEYQRGYAAGYAARSTIGWLGHYATAPWLWGFERGFDDAREVAL